LLAHSAALILTTTAFSTPLALLAVLTGVCFQGFYEELKPLVARLGPVLDDVKVLPWALSGLIGRVLVSMYVPVRTVLAAPLDVVIRLWTPVNLSCWACRGRMPSPCIRPRHVPVVVDD